MQKKKKNPNCFPESYLTAMSTSPEAGRRCCSSPGALRRWSRWDSKARNECGFNHLTSSRPYSFTAPQLWCWVSLGYKGGILEYPLTLTSLAWDFCHLTVSVSWDRGLGASEVGLEQNGQSKNEVSGRTSQASLWTILRPSVCSSFQGVHDSFEMGPLLELHLSLEQGL